MMGFKMWLRKISGAQKVIEQLEEQRKELIKENAQLVSEGKLFRCKEGPWCMNCANSYKPEGVMYIGGQYVSGVNCKKRIQCSDYVEKAGE